MAKRKKKSKNQKRRKAAKNEPKFNVVGSVGYSKRTEGEIENADEVAVLVSSLFEMVQEEMASPDLDLNSLQNDDF